MSTALAEQRPVTAPPVTPDQMDLITRTVAQGATPDELKLYLFDCARQGVHPLDKLIHFTVRKNKDGSRRYTPITSIDFMRIRAAETGEYAGSDDAAFLSPHGHTFPEQATVTVWRLVQGTRCAFTSTARWTEYKPEFDDFMWRKMPHTMLGKCAEALALRKGFPRQLAGLYAKEEMDQADVSNGHAVQAPAVREGRENALAPSAGESGHSCQAPVAASLAPAMTGGLHPDAATGDARGTPFKLGVLITKVDQSTISKTNSKPKWFVHFEDGNKASTIDAKLADQARRCFEQNVRVQPELEATEKWGYNLKRLFEVNAMSATRPALPEIQLHADEHTGPVDLDDIPF